MTVAGRLVDHIDVRGRGRRRHWQGADRLHVEVRGLDRAAAADLAGAVEARLAAVTGVAWAEVDMVAGRVVVQGGDPLPDWHEVVAALEEVEVAAGVGDARFSYERPEHPGDAEVLRRDLAALVADAAGLGIGVSGRLLRATPLPVEAASLVSLVDNEPRLRQLIDGRLGTPVTDLGLAVLNAVGQGLTQGPLGLITDGVHRANLIREDLARRAGFARAEARRWGDGPAASGLAAPIAGPLPRPTPPDGPVERYSDRASIGALAAGVLAGATTRSSRRGVALLLAGIPKAARMGRDAFAAELARMLTARDVLVVDRGALRRLDRVDTVVIDAALLDTGRVEVAGLRVVAGRDAPEVHQRLGALLDRRNPDARRTRGRWSLGPPTAAERRRRPVTTAAAEFPAAELLVLRERDDIAAIVAVRPELSAEVLQVIRLADELDLAVALAGADAATVDAAGAHLPVDADLDAAVAGLQADGCCVALVADGGTRAAAALSRADVGIELPALDGAAWAGALVVNGLADVALVLDAVGAAAHVSRQSVALAATGSGLGALLALTAAPGRAAGRATAAVNAAALAAMANGLRAARYVRAHGGALPGAAVAWHEQPAEQVLAALGTGTAGLPAAEAGRRRRDSAEVRSPRPSLLGSMAAELANPLTPVLGGGAAASAAVGSAADAGIVTGVTALNAVIGGVQRYGAERAIAALGEASQSLVEVRRPGSAGAGPTTATAAAARAPRSEWLPGDELVPGDVVVLRAGDAVPADCRVLVADALEVDESALTGESEPVTKDPAPTFSTVLAERSSMLWEGTTVAAGQAVAVVVASGAATAASVMGSGGREAPSTRGVEARIRRLTSVTLPIAAAGGGAVLGLGLLRGQPLSRSIGSAVALSVAAVPEGLPLLATMAQLAAARRLSSRSALVRNPRAIEALGRVEVLCTDKTGTLTEGRIRMRRVSDGVTDVSLADLSGAGRAVVAAGLRATPVADDGQPLPHLTDRAVADGAARLGIDRGHAAPGWQLVAELPFEPARGYHATLGATGDGRVLSVKGAPEVVARRCRSWRTSHGETALDAAARRRFQREVDRLARQGLRLLAVAEAPRTAAGGDDLDDDVVDGLVLLGLLVLSDPVRPTAARAVRDLRRAGVRVVMVTGDHPSTAEGIAAELGILDGGRALTGTGLAALDDAALDAVVDEVAVFARVTPADKVRIVAALQRAGRAVAMTGDGANDAPAIRLADVGIALGAGATPAARRAADLIVTDERIETIVDAVGEGRSTWVSLREALAILLGGNLGEVAFTVGATAVSGRAPLSARQLLVVNLLTDVAPALAVALRPPHDTSTEALLAGGPDTALGGALTRAIAVRAATTASGAAAAYAMARLTGRRRRASTIALVALVGTQLGQTLTSGRPDPVVAAAGLASAAVLAAIVQTPGVSGFFGCTPLGPLGWAIGAGAATAATVASLVGDRVVAAVGRP
ncbi:MAG TPA: HAD-IC family P-type ATPase [Acidimicrobiales bacterium]|nr:HAD-IC family P-type ATPase [Acidimicrobiales bacterium]